MTYETLLQDAIEKVPEFKEKYGEYIERGILEQGDGMHIVFSLAFAPLASEAVIKKRRSAARIYDFLEEMAGSDDKRVQEVCDQSVLEVLYGEHNEKMLWPLMRRKTRVGYNAVKQYMSAMEG